MQKNYFFFTIINKKKNNGKKKKTLRKVIIWVHKSYEFFHCCPYGMAFIVTVTAQGCLNHKWQMVFGSVEINGKNIKITN